MHRILALLMLAPALALSAVTLTESTQVTLLRGSTTVGTFAGWDACTAEARRLANVSTAVTGTVQFTCQTERRRVVAAYSANPAPPPPPTGGAESPTGRNPTLAWSREQQAVWNRMRAEGHWYWTSLKGGADLTGTAGQRYGDWGQFAAWVYQVTGDKAYAAKAYAAMFAMPVASSFDPNDSRERFTRLVIYYDWLYPALSAAQRTQGMAHLIEYAKYVLAEGAQYTRGTRPSDTDELHGHLGGLVALHYLNVPENTRYLKLLNQRVVAEVSGVDIEVGGIDASAADTSTLRNAVDLYAAKFGPGGVWYESSEYNAGTTQIAALLYEAGKAAGAGKFPLLLSHLRDACRAAWFTFTPGYTDKVYWGDDENPREFQGRIWENWEGVAQLAAYATEAGAPEIAAQCQRVAADLYSKYATGISGAPQFISDAMFRYNPYLPAATLPADAAAHFARGMGQIYVRGPISHFWAMGDTLAGAVDHSPALSTSWQLYRNGSWAVTYPIVYAGQVAQAANGIRFAGLSTNPMEVRQVVRQESGAGWHSLTYRNSGRPYTWGNLDYQPGAFVHGWERRYVYFQEQGLDVVVIRDVADAVHPSAAPNFEFYRADDRAAIAATPAVKVQYLHTYNPATLEAGGFRWTAQNGELVRVRTLLPASLGRRVVAETKADFGGYPDDYEIRHNVQWWDATESQVTTFLTVVVAGNGTLPAISNVGAESVRVGSRVVTFAAGSTGVD